MSASTAIGDITQTLQDLLQGAQQPLNTFDVSLLSPVDENIEQGMRPRINLFLLRVQEDPFAKNQDWRPLGFTQLEYPPLALDLLYLMTAFAADKLDEYRVLGEAMRVFHDSSIVEGAALRGSLRNTAEELKVDLCQFTLEDVTKIYPTCDQQDRTVFADLDLMNSYLNSREHLFDELRRLDLLLNIQVERVRRDPARQHFDQFRGLFIAENEIDSLCGDACSTLGDTLPEPSQTQLQAIRAVEKRIAAHTTEALAQGMELSLPRVADLFSLTTFDVDALLICLAPELDTKYGKLYAYLQDDATRRSAGPNLILNLLCGSMEEKLKGRVRLGPEAPLLRHGLLIESGPREWAPFLSRVLTVDPRILDFLLGLEQSDEQLRSCSSMVVPKTSLKEALLPVSIKEDFARYFLSCVQSKLATVAVFLQGKPGAGKKYLAEALCQALGVDLLVADLRLTSTTASSPSSLVRRLLREASLRRSALYLDRAEAISSVAEQARLHQLLHEYRSIVFLGSETVWECCRDLPVVSVPAPDCGLRYQLWRSALERKAQGIGAGEELKAIADKFCFNPGTIRSAVEEAERLACMRANGPLSITIKDLYAACRARSGAGLASLAHKISPIFSWTDIVLPADLLEQLHEVCSHLQYRQQVFSSWGFDAKFSLGKGLNVLFAGPSGTGKTLAAEIMAGELGLDLYKIDLSSMISKYIGETEKNLKTVFDEAEQSNAILFFDEADAIFGKRSEVKDSHDRYANTEVNYLLQKMEEYSGTVILASNFRKNIDDAFLRRLRFVVEFPFPEEDYRLRIWQVVFPKNVPLGKDVDFQVLASRLKVPGGTIRNIALRAAFMAAADGGIVKMEQVMRSARREFQKMGRVCVRADFGPYLDPATGVV